MSFGQLGKSYQDRELIMRQGDVGEAMYVLLAGTAEVIIEWPDREIRLSLLQAGDIFGEMALFTRQPRAASVRAVGEVRALTLTKREFLRQVHQDPSLAFRILQQMSDRIRRLDAEVARLRTPARTAR